MFDSTKSGKIEKEKVRTILNTLGHTFDDHELDIMLKAEDDDCEYIQPIIAIIIQSAFTLFVFIRSPEAGEKYQIACLVKLDRVRKASFEQGQ